MPLPFCIPKNRIQAEAAGRLLHNERHRPGRQAAAILLNAARQMAAGN
jgi:hypothetical protein